jgi:methionyl-tRNA formyltransferase
MALRVLFLGTPAFAVPSLLQLVDSRHQVVGVVTQPDRPRGRGHRVSPEAVKAEAVARGLPVLQPAGRLDSLDTLASIRALAPDLGVVAAYGRLLPQSMLDVPRLGLINVHASLLPRWRGAAPIHRAVIAGDVVTGVTIMRVVLALDAGPMLAQAVTGIGPNETSHELEARLATIGADLLLSVVDRLASGAVPATPQDEAHVTYAKRLARDESRLDWARPALAVHNQIRGLQPWPLAAALLDNRRVMLLRSTVEHDVPLDASPGTVVGVERDALIVATRPGAVRILEVQEAGRAALSVGAYLNGRHVEAGDRFAPLPAAAP